MKNKIGLVVECSVVLEIKTFHSYYHDIHPPTVKWSMFLETITFYSYCCDIYPPITHLTQMLVFVGILLRMI